MIALSQTDYTAAKCDLVAEVTRTFGESRLKVTGSSMLPSVRPGDVLTVQRKSIANLSPGRIVLFQRNGGLMAHRIMDKRGRHLITRGDALPYRDEPVGEDEVLGEQELLGAGSNVAQDR